MARYVGVAQVIARIKQLCRMIDCFVLAGVKTFSQRDMLSTREMAALSVPSLRLYPILFLASCNLPMRG